VDGGSLPSMPQRKVNGSWVSVLILETGYFFGNTDQLFNWTRRSDDVVEN
jgi:hypothetical protein